MKFAFYHGAENDWRESLCVAASLGLPIMFNIEWFADRSEADERGKSWW